MFVIKRDDSTESVNFEKIAERIRRIAAEANVDIDVGLITQEIVSNMSNSMKTSEIDDLAATICVSKQLENPQYGGDCDAYIRVEPSQNDVRHPSKTCTHSSKPVLGPKILRVRQRTRSRVGCTCSISTRDYAFDFFRVQDDAQTLLWEG